MAKSGIKNLEAFQNRLKKRLGKNPRDHVKQLIRESTTLVENTTKESIASGSPSGRTYQKYNPRRTHTASAAGQPPASDTGFLVQNITSQVKTEGTKVIGQIVASAPYAKPLEFGTTEMLPRPFMQPALERNRPRIRKKFSKAGYLE